MKEFENNLNTYLVDKNMENKNHIISKNQDVRLDEYEGDEHSLFTLLVGGCCRRWNYVCRKNIWENHYKK